MNGEETQRRLEETISSFQARHMNNTKWREVLTAALATGCPMEISTVWEPDRFEVARIQKNWLAPDHIRDPGVGGPLEYREIFALRVPRYRLAREPRTGAQFSCSAHLEQLVEALDTLGQVPVVESDEHLSVIGYS